MKIKWRKIIGWVLLVWGAGGICAETVVIVLTDEITPGLAVVSYGLSIIYLLVGQHLVRKKSQED